MDNVQLISVTKPIHDEDTSSGIDTPEQLIAYCARVSNPDNQLNHESSPKLLAYLIKHSHWSPFEMVSMCVKIKTSRAIAAQILRHRSFSFQEFSQRYSPVESITDINLRQQADKNRQSSSEDIDPVIRQRAASSMVSDYIEAGMTLYSELLEAGVARESARMVLPLATETTLFMTGTVRSWIHYLQLRLLNGTQLEHRIIAEEIQVIFKKLFPEISSALWEM